MPWKNIKQHSFADDLIEIHNAVEELDDVHDLINWERIENLLSGIHIKVKGGKA
jgi:IS5 family transposase